MEFEHEKNIVDYQNNPNSDDSFNPDIFCLICLEQNGVVVLCKRCKYKYCQDWLRKAITIKFNKDYLLIACVFFLNLNNI